MFKCAKCGRSIPGMKPVMATVQTRERTYQTRSAAFRNSDGSYRQDPGGVGYEIVKQVQVHAECPVYAKPKADAIERLPPEGDFQTQELAIFASLAKIMAEQASK